MVNLSDLDPLGKADEIIDRRRRSFYWLLDNFYPQWEQVYKSYKCERDPELDPNTGKVDPTATSIGLPDIFSHVRRNVARGTAQPPHMKYRCKDQEVGELVSSTIMYQWDRGRVQRQQKRHFTQSALFGWSVRPWYWAYDQFRRTRRINPVAPDIDQNTIQEISDQYGVPVRFLTAPMGIGELIRARLTAKNGSAGLLPVKYDYVAYEGPKCDFLFIGDCYPEPNFQTIQSSAWFIVERRRNVTWMNRMIRRYPQLAKGFQALTEAYPDGTPIMPYGDRDAQTLRQRMNSTINRTINDKTYSTNPTTGREWTIIEQYVPGVNSRLSFVGQNNIFIGEIEQPYDLDGMIPFTELVLIDDLLCGIGDSTARIIRGLALLHDRQANIRFDLVDTVQRPLYGTTDPELYDNPELLRRWRGFRLVKVDRAGAIFPLGDQAALASVATGLQDDASIERLLQKATGDSNMSMSAGVDPQQGRTATGARLMAYNQDVLTKDLVDMFTETGLKSDLEMMYLLNRAELTQSVEFDAAPYKREYNMEQGQLRQLWTKAEPKDFQVDGEIVVEAGSTLSDDDEAKVQKAQTLMQVAMAMPQLINHGDGGQEDSRGDGRGPQSGGLDQAAASRRRRRSPAGSLTVSAKMDRSFRRVRSTRCCSRPALLPPGNLRPQVPAVPVRPARADQDRWREGWVHLPRCRTSRTRWLRRQLSPRRAGTRRLTEGCRSDPGPSKRAVPERLRGDATVSRHVDRGAGVSRGDDGRGGF
jgi:hypothetical protein